MATITTGQIGNRNWLVMQLHDIAARLTRE
jgi:hypothetical protein